MASPLTPRRAVSTEEAEKKAESHGATYYEASAKQGININQIFRKIASDLPSHDESTPKFGTGTHDYDVRLRTSPKVQPKSLCSRICNL